MYTPGTFREDRPEVLLEAIATYPLATVITTGAEGIQASHIPLIYVQRGETGVLLGHVARANPHWRETQSEGEALAIFTGPQHYISPAWYPSKREHGKVVPTWNYVAVHVRGQVRFRTDPEWLREMLDTLTNEHESRMGTGWQVSDAPREFTEAQLAAIVGVELIVTTIEGKWKLSQNRTGMDREGVVSGLETVDSPSAKELARAMRAKR